MDEIESLRVERSPSTLRERTLEKLRQAIATMHFKPGERLVERDLCDLLAVSRTVVREALRHLEAEGLVEIATNRGPVVARLTTEQAIQIYEIRGQLEGAAAKACAATSTPALTKKLRSALADIRKGYSSGVATKVLSATTDFYQVLFDHSGHEIAWKIVTSLNGRVNALRAITIATPNRSKDGPREMSAIVDAIEKKDPQAAYDAAIAHMNHASAIAQHSLSEEKDVVPPARKSSASRS